MIKSCPLIGQHFALLESLFRQSVFAIHRILNLAGSISYPTLSLHVFIVKLRDHSRMRVAPRSTTIDDDAAPKRTPLILFWAFVTLIWSIFTRPHKTFPARVLIFQPLWAVRMYIQDATWVQDLLLFLCLHVVYGYCTGAWRLLTPSDFTWVDLHDNVMQLYLKTFGLLGGCGAFAGGIVRRGHQLKSTDRDESLPESRIDEELLPPLLIPSQTTHSRLFPQRHGFSYSYLFVGIPVGIRGTIGNALSVDSKRHNWFHISSNDHLTRGGSNVGLAEKLKRYLHSHGITDRDYAFAYLVTAPRFLGYNFNPVSFWYLYDSDTALKYLILEVNNTFDERRMYLLNLDSGKPEADLNGWPADGSEETSRRLVFNETWEKDFHVSPFNSRNGSYSLRAIDPLAAYQETGQIRIDNTIVLRSSEDNPKVIARVWSQGEPKDAAQVSPFQLAKFVIAWWWVGLATFPRIVWEAQKLFFQRKLHVWFRPEVAESSVSKEYTDDERHLESFFHAFLKDVVEHSKDALRVTYEPAHADGEEVVLYSPGFTYEEDQQKTLTLKILSPAFYSRFVHYAHAKEAFDRECLATDEKNRTLTVGNAGMLPILLDSLRSSKDSKKREQSFPEQIRWSCLRRLRCPPPAASYPHKSTSDLEYNITDIRAFSGSELDGFVQNHCPDASEYRRIVTKLFLAQRFTFGAPALISMFDMLLRAALIAVALYSSDHSKAIDILRPREFGPREFKVEDIWTFGRVLLLANSIHIWALLKG